MIAKTKIAGLTMALMALSVPLVYADNGGEDKDSWHQEGEWHHGQEGHMTAQILNLTEAQQKQLQDIHKKQREAMKNIFEQIKSNREAFNAEIVKAAPDMNKANGIQAQLKGLQSQMADNRFNTLLEIKKIMTPEQFSGYMALEKEEGLMRHKGHDKFGRKDGEGQEHLGNKADKDHDSDDQD